MDVVSFEGDLVVGADEEEGPVVFSVAGGGPGGLAVDFGVGDSDGRVGFVAAYDVLAADKACLQRFG